MTPVPHRLLIAAGLVAAAGPASTQSLANDPLAPLPPVTRTNSPTPQPPMLGRAPGGQTSLAPAALRDRVGALGRAFNGRAGISVVSLRDGWQADYNANTLFPQQSCSKLWVAIAAMDAVDRGRVKLTDRVTLGRSDLTLFHQPLASKILGGGHTTTLGALMTTAITQSDNTANDKLMRSVGGPDAVRDMIAAKGLGAIRFYNGERALQSRIAGLIWTPSYSIGDAFYKARSALPMSVRRASFQRYIEDPYDGAAPHAVAIALARLKRGELLSPASTGKLLSTMASTRTGALRVRAALKPGWKWSHKTGTGQNLGGRVGGINDIGILTAPDGSDYAMAIMTVPNKTDGEAQTMMQAVTRAVIAAHEARRGG
ncbi:serine hydrolase [Sphingomonas sp. LY29]|uniref:serine hydrolase n=1 Tax=Sphingomonas sp. LY29 TaxID=3095341 RepID=UPI002D78016E|nr:serine hydrolase [Sphingomonas sp. LY29]WRP24900.1 serine hydrolase [Sphingomonas sp. LY29]